MRSSLAIFCSSFVVLQGGPWAEAADALTWKDCVRMTAQRNPDLLASLRAMESSRASYQGSWNTILPQVTLSNSYSDGSSFRGGSGSDDHWRAQGSASLNLFDPGQWTSIQSASAGFRQSSANLKVAGSNILLNLYQSFSGLLFAQEQIQVASDILGVRQTNASLIDLRYKSGRESKGNRMRTDAELLQAQADSAQATRDLRVAQQDLGQVMGQDGFNAWVVTGTWTTAELPVTLPDFDALVSKIPKLLAQQAVIDQARAAYRSALAPVLPTLSVNYNRSFVGEREFPNNPSWSFTGLLSYPLFGGGPTSTYLASVGARKNLEKAEQDLRSLKNQAKSDLESAWSGFAQALDQVRVQKAFLDAARQRRAESDIRYESGLMTYENWQQVVSDYVNFEKSYLKSRQSLILAEAQWRFAQGEILGDQL